MTKSRRKKFQQLVIDKIKCFRCKKYLWDIESRDPNYGMWSDAIAHDADNCLKVRPCGCGSKAVIMTVRGYLK